MLASVIAWSSILLLLFTEYCSADHSHSSLIELSRCSQWACNQPSCVNWPGLTLFSQCLHRLFTHIRHHITFLHPVFCHFCHCCNRMKPCTCRQCKAGAKQSLGVRLPSSRIRDFIPILPACDHSSVAFIPAQSYSHTRASIATAGGL
jgi:hypothetical protein